MATSSIAKTLNPICPVLPTLYEHFIERCHAPLQVYFHFRSGNASQRMKQEAATAVASHAISGGSKKSGKKGGNKFGEEINPPKPGSNFGAGDIV